MPQASNDVLITSNDLNSRLESISLQEGNKKIDGQFITELEKSLNLTQTTNGDIPLLQPPPTVAKSKKNSSVSTSRYSLNSLYANTQESVKNKNALNDTTNVINRIWQDTLLGNGNSLDSFSCRNSISNNTVGTVQPNVINLDDLRVSPKVN